MNRATPLPVPCEYTTSTQHSKEGGAVCMYVYPRTHYLEGRLDLRQSADFRAQRACGSASAHYAPATVLLQAGRQAGGRADRQADRRAPEYRPRVLDVV